MAQHTIKGTFSPAEDYPFAVLYKVTPTSTLYVANTQMDEEGNFRFDLDSTATQGMYRLVYALPQEEFNFDIIYNAKEDVSLTFNAETGVDFKASVENTLMSSYTNSMSLISQSIGDFYNQQSQDSSALMSIFRTQKETQLEYEKAAEGTIVSDFIKANKPYVPKSYEDIATYITNIKKHFFDYVDFNNETLQSSNFLIDRVSNYVFGMASTNEDENDIYKRNIDEVYSAMKKAQPEIKSTLLEIIWQQMVDTNFDSVANYISDKYLIKLAESLKDTELVNRLKQFKSLSIGNKAPEFDVFIEENGERTPISMYDLDVAEKYILVFWSSSCSHCLQEIPQLQAHLKSLNNPDYKVIAVGLEDDTYLWEREIAKYPEFLHVLGMGKWENKIGNSYNVNATPTYFVLNNEKKILAKPYDISALKEYISN
ncbi:TlpA family protein disulfide reductase [Flavobacteriaceae bacterium S0825]|uniref:TlpA family protein disulfide reductase n=1 Tax=Gaetbulibacter sp. S0825 TaxID=2720084 RepID=UPI001FCA7E29|nr:TlpA disulfide reductase family protein [Gaetbulibacter sp. S0825]MCK0107727.1 TlpA family protein disulfide reductase [Flavobacteriaceae bacterium S0825]